MENEQTPSNATLSNANTVQSDHLKADVTGERRTLSGMQAASFAAYALSDVATIFPITPASHMSEQIEKWSVEGRRNLMGQRVSVKEMQSEKGAAGAMHGALSGGALASTFTASQGLLLMIPNLYKISGELLPGVLHVTCRSLSAHALSIFGDHQDLMAVRASGCAMLGSSSVQECMDLSLVAHLSAIQGSLPFVHFFDGFRTSDEIETVRIIAQKDMERLVDWEAVQRFRDSAMDPLHPMVRGTAQNSDIYFQNREAPNRFYDALPAIVQANMDAVAKLTGRSYHLFDYQGASDAEHVIVTMGSSCDVVAQTVDYLNARGAKVGVVKVRLFRPFAPEALMDAIPPTARVVCALDRTKEPGCQGEPLLQDVVMAVYDSERQTPDGRPIKVIGGRYGLSSKDFTPAMVCAVFENMAKETPKPRFTVGITDDVTQLSLPVTASVDVLPQKMHQSVFYGFGSDGTVGANKQAARLISEGSGKWVQEYSWFDSKKSGGLTISYLRLADKPVCAPYLIQGADYVACHKDIYVNRAYPLTERLADGGTFVLNSRWTLEEMEWVFPAALKRGIAGKHARLYNIDAAKLAAEVGLGSRINMIMETVFLKLSAVMPFKEAVAALKADVGVMYASKGEEVVAKNLQAIDRALDFLEEVPYPASWAQAVEDGDAQGPMKRTEAVGGMGSSGGVGPAGHGEEGSTGRLAADYLQDVQEPMERLEGDALPTSALNPAGFTPLGGTAYEKRRVAFAVPEWNPYTCVHCYQCSLVCPHAAIRPYLATDEELAAAPEAYETVPPFDKRLAGLNFRIQVYPEDCVGCGSCAYNCPAPGKALVMKPIETQLPTQRENLAFAQAHISLKDGLLPKTDVKGTQLQQPLLEFSSCCGGCGETPHVKMLTQLFGDRLIIANATGCSSIWGGYAPAMPYCKNVHGHGPAWGNSLFEDNAEYGYGIMKAMKVRRQRLEHDVEEALKLGSRAPAGVNEALRGWWDVKEDGERSLAAGQAVIEALEPHAAEHEAYGRILRNQAMLQKKSVWAIGGDGWAFDIDYGGLDEVVAAGEDINILVLDTEGYSNTGGEMSKATQLGSVSTFSLDGKQTPKKRLARMVMQYDYVYVAQVCFGADMQQLIDVMREAEAYDGPSVIVALCPCISWGLKQGMSTVVGACKEAVETGYWTLWHFNPDRVKEGKEPLVLDSPAPAGEAKLREFLMEQNRFASLASREPARSNRLQQELAKEREQNHEELVRQAKEG